MRKREFLAGLGFAAGAGLMGAAQDYPKGKDLGAAPPEKKKEVPHRKVTTRNLFKVPHGYPNGVAIAPEGVWVAEQKAQGYGKNGGHITEDAWLFDWNGKLLKTVQPRPATRQVLPTATAMSGWAPMAVLKASMKWI